LRLASAAANQVAAAINNAELYRLIRDQAERLGGLVRSQQVESRKSRAMLEAIADGVMVTDDENRIVLFKQTPPNGCWGLRRDQVDGRGVGEFIGLFGKAGRAWQERPGPLAILPGGKSPAANTSPNGSLSRAARCFRCIWPRSRAARIHRNGGGLPRTSPRKWKWTG